MNCNESIHSLGSMKDGDVIFLESVKTSDNHQAEDAAS